MYIHIFFLDKFGMLVLQKRRGTQFGAGASESRAEISVLKAPGEKKVDWFWDPLLNGSSKRFGWSIRQSPILNPWLSPIPDPPIYIYIYIYIHSIAIPAGAGGYIYIGFYIGFYVFLSHKWPLTPIPNQVPCTLCENSDWVYIYIYIYT